MFKLVMALQQAVYDLLLDGALDGDKRINNLIQSSLQQLSNDADDSAMHESMLLDAATVFYGCNPKAAVCAWSAVDKHAAARLQQLIDYSLVRIVSGMTVLLLEDNVMYQVLWVHDVIKSIATRKAHTENNRCMTRVWLHDQVQTVTINCCHAMHAMHVVKYMTDSMSVDTWPATLCM
jgi:hypothetical protein